MSRKNFKKNFDSVNKALSDVCQLALKQPNLGQQLVLTADASFRNAGYALMIEKYADQKVQSKGKHTRRSYSDQNLPQNKNRIVDEISEKGTTKGST